MAELQKTADQAEQTSVEKTPEAAAVSGVIGGQPNQEIHGQASSIAHANDKTLSEPDLIAMGENETPAEYNARVAQIQANRFGFFDSEAEAGTKVYEKPAKQAVEPMPAVTPGLREGPYDSTVKLNLQITNVPEVSEGIKTEEALQHLNQVFEAGAESVRPVKEWMETPNVVSDALVSIGPALDNAVNCYANTPSEQVKQDAETLIGQAADTLDRTFSYPRSKEERAQATGNLMPFFFFEGNIKEPISPQTAEQMGLESLSQEELNSLGIGRVMSEVGEFRMPEVPDNLKNLEIQKVSAELIEAMRSKGRLIETVSPGSFLHNRLIRLKAEGSVLNDMITLKEGGPKITALEEFLHGTQAQIPSLAELPPEIREVQVKDFMIRHQKLLGLTDNDITVLKAMKEKEIQRAYLKGWTWKD